MCVRYTCRHCHWHSTLLSYGLMGFLVLLFRFLALLQRSVYGWEMHHISCKCIHRPCVLLLLSFYSYTHARLFTRHSHNYTRWQSTKQSTHRTGPRMEYNWIPNLKENNRYTMPRSTSKTEKKVAAAVESSNSSNSKEQSTLGDVMKPVTLYSAHCTLMYIFIGANTLHLCRTFAGKSSFNCIITDDETKETQPKKSSTPVHCSFTFRLFHIFHTTHNGT